MNYPDEDYVRFYTRDTITWLALEYEGQVVMSLMLHGRFNRSGIFDCGGHEPSHAVTLATRCPPDVAKVGLERLLKTKTWVLNNGQIIWPQYVFAQTCKRTDRARKRESRENLALEAAGQPSHAVTRGHTRSQPVTPKPKQKPRPKPKQKGGESPPSLVVVPEPSTDPEVDRSAPPEPPPLSLQEKSALWHRDPNRAAYDAPRPQEWPEVIELSDKMALVFGHTRRLPITHHEDPRVSKPMALWRAGITQQDLLDAIDGAAMQDGIRKKPGLQTAQWLFHNAERVQEFVQEFARNKSPEPKTVVRPKAQKHDPDEEILAARKRAQNLQSLQNATPEEIKNAESQANAIKNLSRGLMR